ncbi:MAG: putative alkylated repair protein [Ilumatobacteraceae bacterium]|nr:putative alkylated repair protein [Ilumatobacteraceae bacterium]
MTPHYDLDRAALANVRSMREAAPVATIASDVATDLDTISLMWQSSLFGAPEPVIDPTFAGIERHQLDAESWVDALPNWLGASDDVFAELFASLPWRQRTVTMWERLLPEPRLTHWWDGSDGTAEALPVLADVRTALTRHYALSFDSIGFNLYRDGRDSVAWHGDRSRFTHENPVVAIVSTGAARSFMLRPRGGGTSRTFRIGHGDLLVMGGACQHDWEHCVPKVARAEGPRLSIMFRHNLTDPLPEPDGPDDAVAAEA